MKWQVIGVLALAMFIIVLDTTVMNVAIPTIVKDLSTDVTSVQFAIALYALVMSMFMITGGKMGDIWGRKVAFRRALLLYGAGSAVTTTTPSIGILALGWSVMEGIGAALMMPALYTLITANYHDEYRARAFGIIGAVVAGGATFGPIIGGMSMALWVVTVLIGVSLLFSLLLPGGGLRTTKS